MLFSLPANRCDHCGFDKHPGACIPEDVERAEFLRKPYTDAIGVAVEAVNEMGICIDDQPNYPTVLINFLVARIKDLESNMTGGPHIENEA